MLAQSKHNGMALDAPEPTDSIQTSEAAVGIWNMLKVINNIYSTICAFCLCT